MWNLILSTSAVLKMCHCGIAWWTICFCCGFKNKSRICPRIRHSDLRLEFTAKIVLVVFSLQFDMNLNDADVEKSNKLSKMSISFDDKAAKAENCVILTMNVNWVRNKNLLLLILCARFSHEKPHMQGIIYDRPANWEDLRHRKFWIESKNKWQSLTFKYSVGLLLGIVPMIWSHWSDCHVSCKRQERRKICEKISFSMNNARK